MWRLILLIVCSTGGVVYAGGWDTEVLSDSGETLNSVTWHINGNDYSPNDRGSIKKDIPKAAIYHVLIQADGYYSSYQTFSHEELTWADRKTIKIPQITLVEKKPGRVMLAFGGDVMMGRRFQKPYFEEPVLIGDNPLSEGKKLLKHMRPYFRLADHAAVNLESQVSDKVPTERAPKSVTFISPPETIPALQWAGIDYVTLGNNHIYDHLDEGLKSTLHFLDKYQLAYSGAGLNQKQALKPYTWKQGEQSFDWLGFVGWAGGFTPNQVAEKNKGGSAWGSKENIERTVKTSQGQNHATVVQYHGSLEYSEEPTGMTESRLKSAIDWGADLVVAHHPHVTQGLELYREKLIAYSMGNMLFDQYFHSTPLSYVLYVWMDGEQFHRAEVVPVYLKGYQPGPATGKTRQKISQRTRKLSARRGLNLGHSGGHLTAVKGSQPHKTHSQIVTFNQSESTAPLWHFPQQAHITEIKSKQAKRYRLGIEQFNGGEFDGHYWFDSPERSWEVENGEVTSWTGEDNQAVKLTPSKDKAATLSMKTFRRVFDAASDMSYLAKVKTDKALQATLYLQKRGTRDKFIAARSNKLLEVGQVRLSGRDEVQNIQLDFNLPRVGYRSYRLILKVTIDSEKAQTVWLDDASLIQWQGHYTDLGSLPHQRDLLSEATHIGVPQDDMPKDDQANKSVEFQIKYQ